jgi:hypothetical protein
MAAVSIARWLFSEASSGQVPATVADDTSNGSDLTIDYNVADANWTSNVAGNGVDFVAAPSYSATAVVVLSDTVTNGNISASLGGVTSASMLLHVGSLVGNLEAGRIAVWGTYSGNGDFGVLLKPTRLRVRWGDDVYTTQQEFPFPTGVATIGVVVDTAQAVGADRCKVYYDGVLQVTSTATPFVQNTALPIGGETKYISIGNRPSKERNIGGQVYYAELFSGALTETQVADAHTALLANNDVAALESASSTLLLDYLATNSNIFEPVATPGAVTLSADFVPAGSLLFEPAITGSVNRGIDFITPAAAVFDPTLNPGEIILSAGFIPASSAVFNPAMDATATLFVDFIATGSNIFEPVATPGAVTLSANFVPAGSLLFEPAIISRNNTIISANINNTIISANINNTIISANINS